MQQLCPGGCCVSAEVLNGPAEGKGLDLASRHQLLGRRTGYGALGFDAFAGFLLAILTGGDPVKTLWPSATIVPGRAQLTPTSSGGGLTPKHLS